MASERQILSACCEEGVDSASFAAVADVDPSSTTARTSAVNECGDDGHAKQAQRTYGQCMDEMVKDLGTVSVDPVVELVKRVPSLRPRLENISLLCLWCHVHKRRNATFESDVVYRNSFKQIRLQLRITWKR